MEQDTTVTEPVVQINQLVARINALIETAGPKQQKQTVYVGEPGKEDYDELGEFTFKRLSFSELDGLRLHSVNDQGKFDKFLHAGANARTVAATLIDENTGMNIFTIEDINEWPGYIVDAFAAASNRANSLTAKTAKAAAKN
jgi:hypothetical protein